MNRRPASSGGFFCWPPAPGPRSFLAVPGPFLPVPGPLLFIIILLRFFNIR